MRRTIRLGFAQEALDCVASVPQLTISAVQMPRVINSWYDETMTPRITAGVLSDWYMGTTTDMEPMLRPVMRRPMANWAQCVEDDISMAVPTHVKNADADIERRRPIVSAILPAMRAPKKRCLRCSEDRRWCPAERR